MNDLRLPCRIAAICGGLLLVAAAAPSMLATAEPGQWQVERSGGQPQALCVASIAALAQLEHRGLACTRVVVRESTTAATIHYTCAGGGFGESTISLITPRSLRIETQGISGGAPFNYVVQARRTGNCSRH